MDPQRSIVRLSGGRALDVLVGGADAGEALVLINGTPSGVAVRGPEVAATAARGLRFVTYGRPGYADSTRVPGRSVADIAPDVRALAGELGLTRLFVLGWSGGGPHALACAALLPDLRGWGFDLAAIRVPVTIWQGTEDKMVPFAHGRWLVEHIPGARPRLLEGEGHLSLAVSSFDRILGELVEGQGLTASQYS